MPSTPNYSLPYPLGTDPADVPTDLAKLANAVDALPGLGLWRSLSAGVVQYDGEARAGSFNMAADGGKLYFGPSYDTALYRGGAGEVRTDGKLYAGGGVAANINAANQIWLSTDGRLYFGSASDTSLYRASANTLKTDGSFNAQSLVVSGEIVDSGGKWFVNQDGAHQWGPGDWSRDTTLYRKQAGQLKLDGAFFARDAVVVDHGDTGERLWFGSALDTSLQRVAANALATGGAFYADKVQAGGATPILLQNDGSIYFGNAYDTSLFRAAVGLLATNGGFTADGYVIANNPTANRIILHTDGHLYFGSAFDTHLYRGSAQNLKTDGGIFVGKSLVVDAANQANQLYLGGQLDASIWRSGAARITTNSHITISGDGHAIEFTSSLGGAPSGGAAGGAVDGIIVYVDGQYRKIALYNP